MGANQRMLPPLSVLADRQKLKPTLGVEAVAQEVASTGLFDVGWNNGITVSPVGTKSFADFMRPPSSTDYDGVHVRIRTPSSVAFSRKGPARRPQTSDAAVGLGGLSRSAEFAGGLMLHNLTWDPRKKPAGNKRLFWLAQSADSLSQQAAAAPGTPTGHARPAGQAAVAAAAGKLPTTGTCKPPSPADVLLITRPNPDDSQCTPGHSSDKEQPIAQSGSLHDMQPSRFSQVPGGPTIEHRLSTPMVQNMVLDEAEAASKRPATQGSRSVAGASYRSGSRSFMSAFKPTRSQSLLVFNHLDQAGSGKILRAELEGVCVGLGFSLRQAHSLFDRLDKHHRGFLTSSDWGNTDFHDVIEMFSLMYMRRFMGLPEAHASEEEVKRYFSNQEKRKVKNLPAAIKLVRINAVRRGFKAANRGEDIILDAFRYIDTDSSGALSKEEVQDGFAALGVTMAEQVVDHIMQLFDHNNNGTVEYHEFVKTLFPRR